MVSVLAAAASEPTACTPDERCTIGGVEEAKGGGAYRFVLPDSWDGQSPLKAFMFFHGHNGSGAGIVRNKRLVKTLGKAGYALLAPDGTYFKRFNARGWAARKRTEGARNDISFVEDTLRDFASRYPLNEKETVVTGFSSGGSMALYFGCYSTTPLKAVVTVAGGLRRPLPVDGKCPGGVRNILHFHGFSDGQVPLEGRGIRSWHQGDVFEGLAVQRNTNQCRSNPDKIEIDGQLWCRSWTKKACASGYAVQLCLHKGGHGLPSGWLDRALAWINSI